MVFHCRSTWLPSRAILRTLLCNHKKSDLWDNMEPDSGSREPPVPAPSSKSEEEKAASIESGKNCTVDQAVVSSCHEGLENACLKSGREAPRKKLCGYLHKCSGKAPIRAWKSRWFFYEESKCHLLYYRTAQDVNPLGSIDVSSASFDIKAGADEGVFEIRTPSKEFILKAVSKQAMMYWLQQLQIKRWEFCNNQPWSLVEDAMDKGPFCYSEAEHEFLPPVKTPTDVVGIKAASLPAPQSSVPFQNISLKHPWIEIQNTVHNLCGNRQNRGDCGGTLSFEETQEDFEIIAEEEHGGAEAEETVSSETQENSRMKIKPAFIRKTKKGNSGFSYFAEGMGQEKVASLKYQILILTEEVKSQKELVKLLHKALEAAQQEKRESCRYLATTEKDRLELVRHKVRQIAELNKRVEALETERKDLEHRLALKEEHVEELQAHVQLLMDKNQAKQQVVLKLTEQLTKEMSDSAGEADAIATDALYKQQEEFEHLKDDLEAYKTQNQFLNSEIHQVTKIWSTVAQREKILLMKCARLQAHNCQIESKYLMMLRKLQGLPDLTSDHMEMVKGLIQEALQWSVKEEATVPAQQSPIKQYDDYGFMTVPDYEAEDWKLLAKIQALEIKSSHLLNHDALDKSLSERWNNLGELTPSSELKSLLRCGVPVEHRQRVWRWIVSHRVQHIRSPGHYKDLLKQCEVAEHPASRQIELDLPRTLTNNKHFTSPTSQLVPKLRRVLLAFSRHNPTIGYCQGLNRLAAVALLVLEEEENAFWCLVHIAENLMPPDYYSNTLIGSQVDQRVFKDFLSEKLPRLTAHLEQHRIDLALVTFNWFLVVFVDSLVSDILFRVWDAFLYEGTKVIFRYALAIFKYNEDAILRIQDSLDIYQYLRFFTKTIGDSRKLMNIAFSDMNPFPMKLLQNRRGAHRLKLEAELRELERIKAQYMREQADHVVNRLDGAVSEDEEEG
ncbi:TBC1 domain family member 2A isoform X1 [Paroedura picta]|uniref:TBC1 domain family member 2A isoform X1 n=2 Tax=Paroedura picta TaxID=143630 RepID=UPI004055C5E0